MRKCGDHEKTMREEMLECRSGATLRVRSVLRSLRGVGRRREVEGVELC